MRDIFDNHETQQYYGSGSNQSGAFGIGSSIIYEKLHKIEYFKNNNIKIKRVFANSDSHCAFWLTDDNKVYGAGNNDNQGYQLGIKDVKKLSTPILMHGIQNVIDIKSNDTGSIALCAMDGLLLSYGYLRDGNQCDLERAPNDILVIIEHYSKSTKIYTSYTSADDHFNDAIGWSVNESFCDRDIVKIACSKDVFYYLDSNGIIYRNRHQDDITSAPKAVYPKSLDEDSWSSNRSYAEVISSDITSKPRQTLEQIKYDENERVFVDIACCWGQFWARDANGNIREWRDHTKIGKTRYSSSAGKLIKLSEHLQYQHVESEDDIFVEMKPGGYAMSDKGKHFVWNPSAFPIHRTEYDANNRLPILLNNNEIEDISVCGENHHYWGWERHIVVIFKDKVDINIKQETSISGSGAISLM